MELSTIAPSLDLLRLPNWRSQRRPEAAPPTPRRSAELLVQLPNSASGVHLQLSFESTRALAGPHHQALAAWSQCAAVATPFESPRTMQRRKRPRFELIPHKMGGVNARLLLASEVWRALCAMVHETYGGMCCECLRVCPYNRGLECHEVWKYAWMRHGGSGTNVGVMRLAGLRSLCRLCHQGKHFKFAEKRGKLPQVKAHVMELYELSESEWDLCILEAVENKALQYRYKQLDLTYLNNERFGWVQKQFGRHFTDNEMPYIEETLLVPAARRRTRNVTTA